MTNLFNIAMALLRRDDFEGLRLAPYLCPAGFWTIGYGSRFLAKGLTVTAMTEPITEAEALSLLRKTLVALKAKLNSFVTVPLTDHQEGALLSWQYNVGTGAARSSTLVRLLNQRLYDAAGAQFLRWDKATVNGRLITIPGLQRRRKIESDVFLGRYVPPIIESANA